MVPLKYLTNFWKSPLEMPLINRGDNFDLNWSQKCIAVTKYIAVQGAIFQTLCTSFNFISSR